MSDLRVHALLCTQRALWDVVTPGLRAVAICIGPTQVHVRFIYEHEPTATDLEDVSLAETQLVADFDDEVAIACTTAYVPRDLGRRLDAGEEWVYLRKEQ